MEQRICFNSDKVRNLFFNKVLEINELDSWKELSKRLNKHRNVLGDYRSGKLTLPESFYNRLALGFNKKHMNIFSKHISRMDGNWGRSR